MAERHSAILAELSELGLTLARDLQARVLAAETPEDAARLAGAFHRISRSVRQTLALEAKLERDAKRDAREDEVRAEEIAEAKLKVRKSRVEAGVERLIWTEAEEDEQYDYLKLLTNRLDDEDLADPEETVEILVQRIAIEIGLLDPPPQGEVSPEVTEGVSSADSVGFNPLSPSGTAPPQGGASEQPRRSSA